MDRRTFLCSSALATTSLTVLGSETSDSKVVDTFGPRPPAFEITPVVADGKWIWSTPPEGQTGYLEPRPFELSIGIELQGRGDAIGIMASTPAPLDLPEQKVVDVKIKTQGCVAEIRRLSPEAGQLVLAADGIEWGQQIIAEASYKLTLFKQYHAFERNQFPADQKVAKELRPYLVSSPGIQATDKVVKKLATQVGGQFTHPWDKALAYKEWVWQNIEGRVGIYTNVLTAIKNRVGDCEERAAVFVALCRASGIPARLVWVPNHNWAEFHLVDEDGKGHWIPAHTAAYSWFGWTGVHELVLQKGDNIRIPEISRPQRIMEDWLRRIGPKPDVRYFADLKPLPPKPDDKTNNSGNPNGGDTGSGEYNDPGPGERSKSKTGEWLRTGKHATEKHVRR